MPIELFFNVSCGATSPVGVSLMQMQILPSVAFKVSDSNTIGISIAMAVQTFKVPYGLQSFGTMGFSGGGNDLTNNGADWSYGLGWRLGWFGQYLDNRLSLGLNYNARINMSTFKRYAGLFAEGGDFDIPENYGADGRLQVKSRYLKNGQWEDGRETFYLEDPQAVVRFKE